MPIHYDKHYKLCLKTINGKLIFILFVAKLTVNNSSKTNCKQYLQVLFMEFNPIQTNGGSRTSSAFITEKSLKKSVQTKLNNLVVTIEFILNRSNELLAKKYISIITITISKTIIIIITDLIPNLLNILSQNQFHNRISIVCLVIMVIWQEYSNSFLLVG